MKNKTVMITGGNRGIGFETARCLAEKGAAVYLAVRSPERGRIAKELLMQQTGSQNIHLLELDLGNPGSVVDCASVFASSAGKLDVLINNAGMWTKRRTLTESGIEKTFAVNVIGHHLLTKLLIPLLEKGDDPRIINVASHFAGGLDLDDINFDKRKYGEVAAYQQTKQANRMLTREWARRLADKNIFVYSMTPGFVPETELFREQAGAVKVLFKVLKFFGARNVKRGADTSVWLASADTIPARSGAFFLDRKELSCQFTNPDGEAKLWEICEGWAGSGL